MTSTIFRSLCVLALASAGLCEANPNGPQRKILLRPARGQTHSKTTPTVATKPLQKQPILVKEEVVVAQTPQEQMPTAPQVVAASTEVVSSRGTPKIPEQALPEKTLPANQAIVAQPVAVVTETPPSEPVSLIAAVPLVIDDSADGVQKVPMQSEGLKILPQNQTPPVVVEPKIVFPLNKAAKSKFALLTLPGSSTTVIDAIFYQLTGKKPAEQLRFHKLEGGEYCPPRLAITAENAGAMMEKEAFRRKAYPSNFFSFSYIYRNYLAQHPETKVLCLLQDPRDLVVLLAQKHAKEIGKALGKEASLEERMEWIITEGFDTKRTDVLSLRWQIGEALHWMRNPDALLLRVEDFILPEKGSREYPFPECVENILSFLEIELSGKESKAFAPICTEVLKEKKNREQQLWQSYFTEEHTLEFKKRMGPYLIALGYEADDNW